MKSQSVTTKAMTQWNTSKHLDLAAQSVDMMKSCKNMQKPWSCSLEHWHNEHVSEHLGLADKHTLTQIKKHNKAISGLAVQWQSVDGRGEIMHKTWFCSSEPWHNAQQNNYRVQSVDATKTHNKTTRVLQSKALTQRKRTKKQLGSCSPNRWRNENAQRNNYIYLNRVWQSKVLTQWKRTTKQLGSCSPNRWRNENAQQNNYRVLQSKALTQRKHTTKQLQGVLQSKLLTQRKSTTTQLYIGSCSPKRWRNENAQQNNYRVLQSKALTQRKRTTKQLGSCSPKRWRNEKAQQHNYI